MQLTPENCRLLAEGLDHPECVALGPDGNLYAGGEAGQIYKISLAGEFRQLAVAGGFILGLAVDGNGAVHACDCETSTVYRVTPDGQATPRSTGLDDQPLQTPNFPVFDAHGNLYVSESGDYWKQPGTGRILRITPDDRTELFHAGPFSFANGLAIDPTGQWLYIVQSTAPNVVRVPLSTPGGPVEEVVLLPTGTVPDGLAFAADGRLAIACYKPDGIYLASPDGRVELWLEDPTGELLSRPTNVALADGTLYVANLGGWHLTAVASNLPPAPLHYPRLETNG